MAYITLQQVKDYYEITGANTKTDGVLSSIITRLTKAFETYIGRSLEQSTYTEYYDGIYTEQLTLANYPITSVSGIWADYNRIWDSDTLISSDNYIISADQRSIIFDQGVMYDYGPKTVKIIYTAGYTTIPYDVQQALTDEVIRVYKHRLDNDITAKTAPDGSVTRYAIDWLPTTYQILDRYKRRVIC